MPTYRLNDANWIRPLCRIHATALWLYPRIHRERWGAEMRLVFRDRCREAARDGRSPASLLFTEFLPDLAASAGREHFASSNGNHPGGFMSKFAGLILVIVGAVCFTMSAIGLWNCGVVGRFDHPGAFDSLLFLQLALGISGLTLSVIGLRQQRSTAEPRR